MDRALRAVAILLSATIALGFLLFAVEEVRDASEAQQSAIVDPGRSAEDRRAHEHTAARELVDDVNDEILRPFAGLMDTDSRWAQRGVPALLGLFVYGFGLAYLARLLQVRSHTIRHHHPTPPAGPASSPPPPS